MPKHESLEEYKKYVAQRLESLREVFARASIGDYSQNVVIPDTDDEFTDLAAGVQVMVEVIRQRIAELENEIAERKRIEEQIRHQALHDSLTGLPNRKAFEERFEVALARSRRYGEKLGILYLDLDHFKQVNDVMGHQVGDLLLVEFANRLGRTIREEDILARLGGDEFIIVIMEVRQKSDIEVVIKRIEAVLKNPVRVNSHNIFLSTSIGVAVFPDDGQDILSLIANSDSALLEAKNSGRNQHRYFGKN